jgi:hypothetical protein
MNRLIDAGRRAYEFVRNNRTDIALGALSMVGLGIVAAPYAGEAIDAATYSAGVAVYSTTGEWPSWADADKPFDLMNGAEISDQMQGGTVVDTTNFDRSGTVPLQPVEGN